MSATMTAIEAARYYLDLGLLPIPVPLREKAPKLEGWPALRLGPADLPRYFNGAPVNVGIVLGDHGTSDVDLDCGEAITAASELLPETAMKFGRLSKPASHFFYLADPPVRSRRYLDPVDKACLAELRCQKSDGSVGLQTICPPSLHPSGEEIRFEPGGNGHPAKVAATLLQTAVARVAAASVFARHWPPEKSGRNQAFIALAGALARGGWALDQAVALHRALYRILWNSQANLEACRAEVEATYQKQRTGLRTTGRHTLQDFLDKRVVAAALSWLGITQAAAQPRPIHIPASLRLEDLMSDTTIAVPELLVDGFLPRAGLVLLGGRPKDGKSWFACQLALSVVTGQALGGWLEVKHPGRVQLWALEDHFAITKDKFTKLLCGGVPPDGAGDLRIFAELALPILNGGDQILRAALKEHPAELVILDSLFKLSGAKQPQSNSITQTDYDTIDRVRQVALDCACCAVIVMHTKKGAQGGNPIENLIGTSGTPAAADAVAELKRFRQGARLTVTGRSVPADDFELAWHAGPEEWGWTIQDQGPDAGLGETSEEVMAYLQAQGAARPTTIATALRKPFGAVWQALLRLQGKGKVSRMEDKSWKPK
jgi:hypothetical protein